MSEPQKLTQYEQANHSVGAVRETPLLFTENNTNHQRLSCKENDSSYVKDAFHKVDAMNHMGTKGTDLWNEEDGFYYDVLHLPSGENIDLKVRSLVGLIPLFAVTTAGSPT